MLPRKTGLGMNPHPAEHSLKYYLETSQWVQVCQQMFLATFGITRKTMRTALAKKEEEGNLVSEYKKGKSAINVKYHTQALDQVKCHTKRIPVMGSHFCRKKSKRQYLACNMNVSKMYKLFKQENLDISIHESYYRKCFNENFNLGFH